MAEQNVPVPAESLRTIATHAVDEAVDQRRKGNTANARRIEQSAGDAISRLDSKAGEFVSMPATELSTLVAFGGPNWKHRDAARVFLEQYGIWG